MCIQYLKEKDAFRSHVEQEVENAEIGQESCSGCKHLIILARLEAAVGQWTLRHYGFPIIHRSLRQHVTFHVLVGEAQFWTHVEQFTHLMAYLHVEVEEVIVATLEKRMQVVCIILKERRLAVCALQGIPMQLSPTSVVADAYVAYRAAVEVAVF